MKKIENFINENMIEFNNLNDSEVVEIDINEFDMVFTVRSIAQLLCPPKPSLSQ